MIEFKSWPKTPRLFRDITITEKIDGTNAAVQIHEFPFGHFAAEPIPRQAQIVVWREVDESGMPRHEYLVVAQSRKRIITPDDDNAGFARWTWDSSAHLANTLGPGTHFGEWWGKGIQRNYGLDHKRFSLFNTAKWGQVLNEWPDEYGLAVVPTLYQGPFAEVEINEVLDELRTYGSVAAPFYDKPEGIVVYHSAANQVFKVLMENDELPKGLVNA